MKVIITVDFQDGQNKTDFLSSITSMLGELCGVAQVNAVDAGNVSVIHCCQLPIDDVSAAAAVASIDNVPPVELSSDTFDADLEAQQMAMAAANDAQTIELPAIDIPAAEVSIDDPTDILSKDELSVNDTVNNEIDLGKFVILSLTSANSVPTKVVPNGDTSYLAVQGVTNSDGLVDFWFGQIEFRIPPVVDASAVANPSHPIGPNTIRVVIKPIDSESTIALLVDVINGDMEMLTISGADAAGAASAAG